MLPGSIIMKYTNCFTSEYFLAYSSTPALCQLSRTRWTHITSWMKDGILSFDQFVMVMVMFIVLDSWSWSWSWSWKQTCVPCIDTEQDNQGRDYKRHNTNWVPDRNFLLNVESLIIMISTKSYSYINSRSLTRANHTAHTVTVYVDDGDDDGNDHHTYI